MNSHELQRRIRSGDRGAFRELYAVCGQGVYLRVQEALGGADAARDAVKQVFLELHHEILGSDRPLDIDARLSALTEAQIQARRMPGGDASAPVAEAPASSVAEAPAPSVAEAPAPPVAEAFENAAPYRPPLERAQAYMDADKRIPPHHGKPAPRGERRPKQRGNAIITILIVLFLLLFLWVLAGILMDFEVLPRIDLGYRWFNESVFPLFKLDA